MGAPGADPNRLTGSFCTVTLDPDARTLTFEHRGRLLTDEQKATPTVVLPLAVISNVRFKKGRFSHWLRVELRGAPPKTGGASVDLHGLACDSDPTAFAERVRAAVAVAAPMYADELPEPQELEPTPPGWGSRVGKFVGRAVVDGLFNTR